MHAVVLLLTKHGVPYDRKRKSAFIRIQLESELAERYKIR